MALAPVIAQITPTGVTRYPQAGVVSTTVGALQPGDVISHPVLTYENGEQEHATGVVEAVTMLDEWDREHGPGDVSIHLVGQDWPIRSEANRPIIASR